MTKHSPPTEARGRSSLNQPVLRNNIYHSPNDNDNNVGYENNQMIRNTPPSEARERSSLNQPLLPNDIYHSPNDNDNNVGYANNQMRKNALLEDMNKNYKSGNKYKHNIKRSTIKQSNRRKRSADIVDKHDISKPDNQANPGLRVKYTLVEKFRPDHNEQYIKVTIIDENNQNVTIPSHVNGTSTTAKPSINATEPNAIIPNIVNKISNITSFTPSANATPPVTNTSCTPEPVTSTVWIAKNVKWSGWYNSHIANKIGDKELLSEIKLSDVSMGTDEKGTCQIQY